MQQTNIGYFSELVRPWRSRVTKHAYYGLFIALAAVALATLVMMVLCDLPLTLAGFYCAHCRHESLLALDMMPFGFAVWGQYAGVICFQDGEGNKAVDRRARRDTDRHDLHAESRHTTADLDKLTGLASRACFMKKLERAIVAAKQSRTRLGVVVLDLDGFSEVNEQFGAVNGDRVLESVARRLHTAMADSALIARLGGDSFGMLLHAPQSAETIESVGRRVRQILEPPCTLDSLALNLGASIGAALYPDSARHIDALLDAADGAMQHAKTRGGGFQLVRARRPLRDAEMRSLSAELRSAIDNEQLRLHLQPIVELATNRVHGLEALVRWQHPRRGLIMPGEFIPRAERIGLMRALSHWVLRQALKYMGRLHRNDWRLHMSVNLSARSLLDPDLPDILAELLATHDVPGPFLTLEITEDTLMADQRRTLDVVTRIANMGIQISIDDFGTGYSQLAYLKRLPVSEIKIDRSFVQDMLASRTDLSIVQATIGLAHALNMRAVGEGIEEPAQAEQLRALGCDLIQGFHIGRPMAMDKLHDWLVDWHPGATQMRDQDKPG